ncbi:MAG TPA: hypothetical protein EYP22_06515 [Methanosarcinales archaeon]|nr:hypothetical protein [Methanosarcinales archaeon]
MPEVLHESLPLLQEVEKFDYPKYALKMATGTGKTWVLTAIFKLYLYDLLLIPVKKIKRKNGGFGKVPRFINCLLLFLIFLPQYLLTLLNLHFPQG